MLTMRDTTPGQTPPRGADREREAAILAKAGEINEWYEFQGSGRPGRYPKPLMTLLAELSDLVAPRPGEEEKG